METFFAVLWAVASVCAVGLYMLSLSRRGRELAIRITRWLAVALAATFGGLSVMQMISLDYRYQSLSVLGLPVEAVVFGLGFAIWFVATVLLGGLWGKLQPAHSRGFTLIELLIVVAIIGIIASIAIPQLTDIVDRGRQSRTMGDMSAIATANELYRVDYGHYAHKLTDLQPTYIQAAPAMDAWNNPWNYVVREGKEYTLSSFGSDGSIGPEPPASWVRGCTECDLVLRNGSFVQAPNR